MNIKKFTAFALAICSAMLFSCTEQEDAAIIQDQGKIEFSFAASSASNQRVQRDSASFVLISIVDANGKSILERHKIKLYYFSGNIISEPISLKSGKYFLTEYFVLDSQDGVIYATPKKEAKLDYLVDIPLPIEFTITKDHTEKVVPKVVSTSGIDPIDFGYTTFSFEVIHTFDFLISVFTYDAASNNFELTDAKLQIKNSSNVLYAHVIADSTNSVKIRDGYNAYQLIVSKDGYATYQHEFSASELKAYSNRPLIVKLFAGANIDSSLVAYYPLNANAKDAGNHHYDGTIYQALPTSDRFGKTASAYQFDGVNDKITFGNVLDFQSSDFTISFWMKIDNFKGQIPNTGSYGSYVISKGITIFGTPKRAGYAINAYKSDEGKNYLQFFLGNQQDQIFKVEKEGFTEAEWYHIVVQRHALKQNLYVNGELAASVDLPNVFSVDTNIPLVFGSIDKLGNDLQGTTFTDGAMDEVRFHDRALSLGTLIK